MGDEAPPTRPTSTLRSTAKPASTLSFKRWWLASRDDLDDVLEDIAESLTDLGLALTIRLRLTIALREAIANGLQHGRPRLPPPPASGVDAIAAEHGSGARVHVLLVRVDDTMRCVVRDEGDGFDPASVPAGTGGLAVIRSLMDEVVHEDGGRTIVMVRRLQPTIPP